MADCCSIIQSVVPTQFGDVKIIKLNTDIPEGWRILTLQ